MRGLDWIGLKGSLVDESDVVNAEIKKPEGMARQVLLL